MEKGSEWWEKAGTQEEKVTAGVNLTFLYSKSPLSSYIQMVQYIRLSHPETREKCSRLEAWYDLYVLNQEHRTEIDWFLSLQQMCSSQERKRSQWTNTDTTPCPCCRTSVSHVWWMVIDICAGGGGSEPEVLIKSKGSFLWLQHPLVAAGAQDCSSVPNHIWTHVAQFNRHICMRHDYLRI